MFPLTPLGDDWNAHYGGGRTAHTSATHLYPAFGNDGSPIPHGLLDVSECAPLEPNSPPKAGEGTSDCEMLIDDDKERSGKIHMPFDNDLCELSDHDSDVEAHTGARDQHAGPDGRSGPSRETKRARADLSISDAQRSLSNKSIGKLLARECDCGKDYSSSITHTDTLRWGTATYDFCRHGRVADHALKVLDAMIMISMRQNVHNKNSRLWYG